MTRHEAHAILTVCGIRPDLDFHELSTSAVDALLRQADARKYRKPKNANGSRARYFHARVMRAFRKAD